MLNAGTHAHTHADTHKRMHTPGLTFSRAQGGSSRLRAPGLCAYLEEAYLLVLKYEPEKQVSDLTSIWESAKLFRDGDWWAPSFFFPFFFFPGGCHLQALSLPHYSLLYLTDRSLYSNLSLDFCHCHHTGDTSRSPGTEDK